MTTTDQPGSSVLEMLFNQNTWANLRLLDFCEKLTDEQLDSTIIGTFGTIRETLRHYINSEVICAHYGKGLPRPVSPDDFPGFAYLKEKAAWAGPVLLEIALSAHAGDRIYHRPPRDPEQHSLAGLLMQAITHSGEHRTQISAIITQLGLEPPDITGWGYLEDTGDLRFNLDKE